MVVPFYHPFTGVCSGPTGSGKTQLMKNIILNIDKTMSPVPQRIVWYYAESQPGLEAELGHLVEFREGMPELSEFTGEVPVLIIIDDFMSECSTDIGKLFTKGSHHRNLSVWFLMQNFFHQGKEIRTITLNAHYIILFKNPRDTQQLGVLARQMFGRNSRVMEEAFSDATSVPHGYLLLDLKQRTDDNHRMRTNILPGEYLTVYVNKKTFKQRELEIIV
jgi:hypothetical protein